MGIVAVSYMWSKDTSSGTLSENNQKLTVTFQEAYQVVATHDATYAEVYSAADPTTGVRIPYRAESFPGFNFVYAKSVSPVRVSPILWMVTCNYEGEMGQTPIDSPLNKPTQISWSDTSTMEELDQDFDGGPLVNANGEPIKGIKTELVDDVLTLKRNFLNFSPYVRGQYRRAVNSDTFAEWPPGTAKVKQFDASNVIDDSLGVAYWQVTLKVQFRYPYNTTPLKAWYSRTLHQGYNERYTVGGPVFKAMIKGPKADANKPVMLDINGLQIHDPANAFFIEKKLYDSLPFNALGF